MQKLVIVAVSNFYAIWLKLLGSGLHADSVLVEGLDFYICGLLFFCLSFRGRWRRLQSDPSLALVIFHFFYIQVWVEACMQVSSGLASFNLF